MDANNLIKNTFILRSGNQQSVGHNTVLNEYQIRMVRLTRPTAYVCVGAGTGNINPATKTMFNFLYAAETEAVEHNYNNLLGPLYIVKKAVIPKDVLVGAVITEVGLAYDDVGSMTTLSILQQPIIKGEEALEIVSIVYLAVHPYHLPGENPLMGCYFGEDIFSDFDYSGAVIKYIGGDLCAQIPESERHSMGKVGTVGAYYQTRGYNIADLDKPDFVLFVNGMPSLIYPNAMARTNVTNAYFDTTEDGKVILASDYNVDIDRGIISGYEHEITRPAVFGSGLRVPDGCTLKLDKRYKVVFAANRMFFVAYWGKILRVYINANSMIKLSGETVFANNISAVSVSDGYIVVLCNHADTLVPHTDGRRLNVLLVRGGAVTQPNITADLPADVDGCYVQVRNSNEINIYAIKDGVLTEYKLPTVPTGTLTETGSAAIGSVDYLRASHKRGMVFGLKLGGGGTGNIRHYFADGLTPVSFGTSIATHITSNNPDTVYYSGEMILTYNSADKILKIFGYINGTLKTFDLSGAPYNAQKVFFNEGVINIVTAEGTLDIYEPDNFSGELAARTSIAVQDAADITGVYTMCDTVAVRKGDSIECHYPVIAQKNIVWGELLAYSQNHRFGGYRYTPNPVYNHINFSIM